MRKLRCGRDLLCMFPGAASAAAAASSCLSCIGKNNNLLIKGGEENENEFGEIKPLISITDEKSAALKVKDVIAPTSTLAFHLKPKVSHFFTTFILVIDLYEDEIDQMKMILPLFPR